MISLISLVVLLSVWASETKTVPQTNSQQWGKQIGIEPQPKGISPMRVVSFSVTENEGFEKEDLRVDMQQGRFARAAEDVDDEEKGDQRSTFGSRYPSSYDPKDFTTPQAALELSNSTQDGDSEETRHSTSDTMGEDDTGNGSTTEWGTTQIHNPLFPVTDSSYSAYGVLFLSLVVFAMGIVGNLAVMCIVWHNYFMRSAWNYIVASLAFWDFLVLCFCLPVVVFNELTNKRLLGDVSCRIVPYMEVTSLGVTSFSLCALGIDRFHAATSSQPKAQRIEGCQSILAKLVVVWVSSMVLAAPELLLWQLNQGKSSTLGTQVDSCVMDPNPNLPESIYALMINYHDARTWWYFGCYFCLPVLFTVLCQLATCHVSGSRSRVSKRPEECSPSKKQKLQHAQQVERQLNCTVMALAVVYGICVLPENVCNLTVAYAPMQVSEDVAALLALINQFFLFFKSSVTPVLLLCLCKSLGQAFMDCCCCCCEECQPGSRASSSHTTGSTAAESKLKTTNEMSSSIFFDKAKDTSTILAIGTSS